MLAQQPHTLSGSRHLFICFCFLVNLYVRERERERERKLLVAIPLARSSPRCHRNVSTYGSTDKRLSDMTVEKMKDWVQVHFTIFTDKTFEFEKKI